MEKKKIIFIAIMHFFLDSYMGYFAIYLVIAHLDPVRAALIATVSLFIGNVSQPFMGYAADKIRGKLPLFLGLILTPISMSMLGLTNAYGVIFILVIFGHIGSSLFHPAGVNIAGAAGITKKDRSVAIFATVGTVGFSFSQPIFSAFTGRFGLQNSYILMFPAVFIAFIFLLFSKTEIHGPDRKLQFHEMKDILAKRLSPILMLFLIMVFRTSFVFGLVTFVAKTFEEWGFPRSVYSIAVPVFMLSAAGGILTAGHVTHLVKPRLLLLISLTAFLPFFLGFLYFGSHRNLYLALVFLALTGLIIHGGYASNIVMGHRVAPEMTSTISGILMGFAWAASSYGPTLCAYNRDTFSLFPGLASGLLILAAFPLAATVFVGFLSKKLD